MKYRKIKVPIYELAVYFVFDAPSPKKFKKAMRKMGCKNAIQGYVLKNELINSFGFSTNDGPRIIYCSRDGLLCGTVPHECLHMAFRILKDIGVKKPHEEAVAYLMGHLYTQFMEMVNDATKQ